MLFSASIAIPRRRWTKCSSIHFRIAFPALSAALENRCALLLENLALRHQIAVFERSGQRPKLRNSDRAFWAVLSWFWKDWKQALVIVQPETVVRWRKKGLRLVWNGKKRRRRRGRPPIAPELQPRLRLATGPPQRRGLNHEGGEE